MEKGEGECRRARRMLGLRLPEGGRSHSHKWVHPRPFVGVSQKSIFKRPCQVLAINAHKMVPRPPQGLQNRPWNAPTKGLLWVPFPRRRRLLPLELEMPVPQKALSGGIPRSFLEPLGRSWSHFVGIYRQKLMKSSKDDF